MSEELEPIELHYDKLIEGIPLEKMTSISKALFQMSMLMLDVEISLQELENQWDIKVGLFSPHEVHPTLWCQMVVLERAFNRGINEKSLVNKIES